MELSDQGEYRDLVICNNCLWSASLLRGPRFVKCHICGNDKIEIVPVGDQEGYDLIIGERGVEIDFHVDK